MRPRYAHWVRQARGFLALIAIACAMPVCSAQGQEPEPAENYQIVTHCTVGGALKKIFPDADEVGEIAIHLDPAQAKAVEARVGYPLPSLDYTIFVGKRQGVVLGYALIDDEIGKYHPITSMIGVDTRGKVLRVAIMVYRESRGGEVSHRRFLQQFEGKTSRDPVRIKRDIISISGATLSVRAVSTQVRKALAIVQEVFLQGAVQ